MRIEYFKEGRRKARWRLRDEKTGEIVPLKLGRVHLPPTPAENRRVQEAVDRVLDKLAKRESAPAGR